MASAPDAWNRLRDGAVASAALVVFAPVLLAAAFAVKHSLGRPILFRQSRPGLAGRPFTMVKFRTMHLADQDSAASDEERLTATGRFLRATSLDELPTLWNVVRGDMALVGPRPLLTQYLSRYSPEQARRHEVRPGLTGWAQVNGRNNLGWDQRLALDVWYVDHRSWKLDLHILRRTLVQVLRRDGISAAGHATMPEFRGPSSDPHEVGLK